MLTLKVDTDNAAFEGDLLTEECARILRYVADQLEGECRTDGTILDANGNRVGKWSVVL